MYPDFSSGLIAALKILGGLFFIIFAYILWGFFIDRFICFIYAILSNYKIKNKIIKHQLFFITDFTIPVDKIISMRTNSENHSGNEQMPSQFWRPGSPYLVITSSKDGKHFVTKHLRTDNPTMLKKQIEDLQKTA